MRLRRRLVWNCLSSGLLLCVGSAVQAQSSLEKLERSVQTLPPPQPIAHATDAPGAAVEPGYLGIVADDVTIPTKGVQLLEVLAGGPAQTAGLQAGDYITSIDGKNAATLDEMAALLATRPAGDQVTFVLRRGQEVLRADVTLGKRPPPEERKFGNFGRIHDPNAQPVTPASPEVDPKMIPPEPPTELPPPGPRVIPHPADYSRPNLGPLPTPPQPSALSPPLAAEPPPLLGVRAVPVTPEMQVSLNLPEPRGALIVEVRPNSPAHRVGLPLEAVIVAVDGKRIDSPTELSDVLTARGLGASVRVSFFRYGQLSERTIKLGEGGPPPVTAVPVDPSTSAPIEFPGGSSPVEPTPTPAPAPSKSVPPPPEPALPPSVIAPSPPVTNGPTFAPPSTAPIATPLPPSKPESENEELRRRVEELEKKLAETEAKLKAEKSKDQANDKEKAKP